jgi:hypothetical protein
MLPERRVAASAAQQRISRFMGCRFDVVKIVFFQEHIQGWKGFSDKTRESRDFL